MAGKKSKKKKGGEKKKAKNKEKAKKPKEVWEELARNSKSAASELKFLGRNVIQDMFLELSDERKDDYPNQVVCSSEMEYPVLAGIVVKSVALTKFDQLTQLRFWHCNFGDAGTQYICEGLAFCPKVDKLEIMDCGVGPMGCSEIAKLLRRRGTCKIKLLKLDHNNLIGDKGVALLAGAFAFNETVTNLSLTFCGIGPEGGKPLAALVLAPDSQLKKLNLEGNELRDAGIVSFCQGLKGNKKLEHLSISNCSFGSRIDPVAALCEAFKGCTTLWSINMDGNQIGDEGCKYLVESLHDVKHIYNLEVTEFISPVHFHMLMEWLVANFKNKPKKEKKGAKKKGSKKKKKK